MLEIWIRVSQITYLTFIRIEPQNPWSQSDILTKQFEVKVFRLLLVRLYKKNWYRNKLDHKWMNEKKIQKEWCVAFAQVKEVSKNSFKELELFGN